MAMLWVLNFSDGRNSLLDIAERSGMDFNVVLEAATALREAGLLSRVEDNRRPDAGAKRDSRGKAGSPDLGVAFKSTLSPAGK
jgi:hypothetical protein